MYKTLVYTPVNGNI